MIGVLIALGIGVLLVLTVRRVVGGKRVRSVGESRTVIVRPVAGRFDRRGRNGL